MRAILIDPSATPAISEVEIKGDLAGIQELVGGYIEPIMLDKDVLYIDEDWRNKSPEDRHKGTFRVGSVVVGGRGLILSKEDGKGTKLKLLEASSIVTIIGRA